MPKRSSKPKRPRDINQLAKAITQEATEEKRAEEAAAEPIDPIRQAAVELGRRGGLKGGPARAKRLTAARLSEIAKKAARARWGNNH